MTPSPPLPSAPAQAVYGPVARGFHWTVAAGTIVMVPLGLAMTYRGGTLAIWDGLTNALYSAHKLIGFLLLWLMVGRLIYRLVHGAPRSAPGLALWRKAASHAVHWLLYGLLLIVPLLGWIGISLLPALDIFGLFSLPALAAPNETLAARVLGLHGSLAIAVGVLAAIHILAALQHHLIAKDSVLLRMWPGATRRR